MKTSFQFFKNYLGRLIMRMSFILFIALFVSISVKAQPNLCDDPCPPGIKTWIKIPLCIASSGIPPNPITTEAVWVDILYSTRTCNGITSILIDAYTLVDIRNDISSFYSISNCSLSNPISITDIKKGISDAISILVNKLGNISQGTYDVYFKESCASLVQLSFPDSAFFVSAPDDYGMIDTVYVSSNTPIYQSIPCSDVCCKVSFEWQEVTLSNGETVTKLVPVSSEGDGEDCENQPLPDYSSYSNPLILTVYDPITGGYNIVVGEVVNQEPCEVICPRIVTPNQPSSMAKFKSDLRTKEIDLQLSVGPVPFNNFIDIISNSTIDKIVVYDMNGKKVLNSTNLENGKLNTSQLKSGAYYVQVHLSDNIVKSIKIIKQ